MAKSEAARRSTKQHRASAAGKGEEEFGDNRVWPDLVCGVDGCANEAAGRKVRITGGEMKF